jgi:hypothetical protein
MDQILGIVVVAILVCLYLLRGASESCCGAKCGSGSSGFANPFVADSVADQKAAHADLNTAIGHFKVAAAKAASSSGKNAAMAQSEVAFYADKVAAAKSKLTSAKLAAALATTAANAPHALGRSGMAPKRGPKSTGPRPAAPAGVNSVKLTGHSSFAVPVPIQSTVRLAAPSAPYAGSTPVMGPTAKLPPAPRPRPPAVPVAPPKPPVLPLPQLQAKVPAKPPPAPFKIPSIPLLTSAAKRSSFEGDPNGLEDAPYYDSDIFEYQYGWPSSPNAFQIPSTGVAPYPVGHPES